MDDLVCRGPIANCPSPRGLRICRFGLGTLALFCALLALPTHAQEAPAGGDRPASSPEAMDAFASAANLQNNGQFDLAADEWAAFLAKYASDPLAPKARHYLGVCRLQLKQYAEAEKLFAEVVKDKDFPLREEALLNLGFCQYSLGKAGNEEKLREATTTFRSQLKQFPQGKLADQALYFQGEAWYELRDWAKAAIVYKALLDHFPKSSLRCDAWYALGTAYEGSQKWADATAAYDEFLKHCADDPDVVAVKFRKAETLVPQKRYAEALALYDEVAGVEGFPDAMAAELGAASCEFYQGNYDSAAKRYLAIAKGHPGKPIAVTAELAAGKALYRAKQYGQAREVLRSVVGDGGDSKWEAAHWIARIDLATGKPEQALAVLDQVGRPPAGHETEPLLQLDRADASFDSGKLSDALRGYISVADQFPRHTSAPQARFNAAVTALQLGNHEAAQAQAERFLSEYTDHELVPDVRFVLAESLLASGDAERAEAEYTKLIEEFPNHPEAPRYVLRRAAAWYVQKRFAEVIEALSGLVDRLGAGADKAQAEFLIGVSYFGQGDDARAAEHLRASVLADAKWPQADEALLFLGRAYARSGKPDHAEATLKSLLKNYPDSPLAAEAYYRLGEVQYAQQDYANAAKSYEQSFSKSPSGKLAPFALSGRGWALLKQGEFEQAEAQFSKLIKEFGETLPGKEALLARAMCRRQLKQYAPALADLDAFLAMEGTNKLAPDALYEKGLVLVALNKNSDAASVFRDLLDRYPAYQQRDRVWFELAWALKSDHADEAVKAFEELVRSHPQSPFVGESWFQIGEARYKAKEYAAAAAAYRKAQQAAQDADVGELATYKLGWALYHQGQFDEAAKQFTAQTENYSQGSLYADGLFMRGECLFKLKQYENAWESFQAAKRFPPRSAQIGALLLLHGAQSAAQLKQWKAARQWLDEFTQKYADSPLYPEALYELGRAAHALGDAEAARTAWAEATAKSKSVIAVQAQFMLGELAFEQKKFDEAEREFRRAMFRFGAEKAPVEFHPWQARAAFEAARCHEVQIKDAASTAERVRHLQEADRFYRHVVDKYPKSDVAEAARKRLAALAQLR